MLRASILCFSLCSASLFLPPGSDGKNLGTAFLAPSLQVFTHSPLFWTVTQPLLIGEILQSFSSTTDWQPKIFFCYYDLLLQIVLKTYLF